MPTYQTTGFVLKRHNFGEADRIITFFTNDRGKVRAVAKGVRRITSKFGGHLEVFGEVQLMLAVGKNLDVVTSARLQQGFENLSQNYSALSYAYLIGDMTDKLTVEDQALPVVYKLLAECFGRLEAGEGDDLFELYFKLRLLDALGYRPELDDCVVCGQAGQGDYQFSDELGGVLHMRCKSGVATAISLNQIKLWRLIYHNPLSQIRKLGGVEKAAGEGLGLCDRFYEFTLGRSYHPALQ
jgi:DNA repair protein RecO (recombination protein O)